jgi:DNA (cytosine-5)-methyltransferase 1
MTQHQEWPNESINLLVGGTPCQSFSVAGLRKGLDDPRGNLMLTYGAIARQFRPEWLVWENVPGVLSSNKGRDFGTFLRMLAECGYGFAYRILDAQYFGVAQRRRRVFVVGYLGDWRRAAAVLFESESLCGNPAPSRYAGEDIAFNAQGSSSQGLSIAEISPTLDKSKVPATYGIPGNWIGRKPENGGNAVEPMHNVAPCLTKTDQHGVAYSFDSLASNSMKSKNPNSGCRQVDLSCTIDTTIPEPSKNQGGIAIMQSSAVRRLTPIECERLQGFPDNYTNIKPNCPDGPRYKALGNSMAVPVMNWIGKRIKNL